MQGAELKPTPNQTYEIICGADGSHNYTKSLKYAIDLQHDGELEKACNVRFKAVQELQELLPEDEEIMLEWNHKNSNAALEIMKASAIDHFLISDFEISSALLEMLLELDPEDHLEASNLLAFNYLAIEEHELFEEVINDISDKHASRTLLLLWSSFLRDGALDAGELRAFQSRFAPFYKEFISLDHPADNEYLNDIESERPSLNAQARELWFQTEHLWAHAPEFIEALRKA